MLSGRCVHFVLLLQLTSRFAPIPTICYVVAAFTSFICSNNQSLRSNTPNILRGRCVHFVLLLQLPVASLQYLIPYYICSTNHSIISSTILIPIYVFGFYTRTLFCREPVSILFFPCRKLRGSAGSAKFFGGMVGADFNYGD